MAKIEIVEFDGGYYAARYEYDDKTIRLLNLRSRNWISRTDSEIASAVSTDLKEVKKQLAYSGYADGIPIRKSDIITAKEFVEINDMAQTDEGMKEMLEKIKEFYLLKKK